MNNLKKLIVLVTILLVEFCFADEGIVDFSNTQTYSTNISSKAIVYDGTNTIYVANGTYGILALYDINMSKK
ncbi:MAG: hypothetical protein KAJ49_04320, partial [Arcobacteraceae bacterium]|nr:hypothetical protein [Arcobacteraceae bacterium]